MKVGEQHEISKINRSSFCLMAVLIVLSFYGGDVPMGTSPVDLSLSDEHLSCHLTALEDIHPLVQSGVFNLLSSVNASAVEVKYL